MFNVKHWADDLMEWLDEPLGSESRRLLARYAAWLEDEAIPAGAIGRAEAPRIELRHLADSLALACGISRKAASVIDVGSGAGLPGIPLAILRPDTHFLLLDRSQKRVDLANRAVRILGLKNAVARAGNTATWAGRYEGLVMRAALPVRRALPIIGELLTAGSHGVVALSRRTEDHLDPSLVAYAAECGLVGEVMHVPVLDSPTWLLRIERRDNTS